MNRADHKPQALKAKQVRLLDLFRQHGPISIRAITPHVKGNDTHQHIKDVHAGEASLCALEGVSTAGAAFVRCSGSPPDVTNPTQAGKHAGFFASVLLDSRAH
jgi:hypothetical protein